jgi:hypothetical protein
MTLILTLSIKQDPRYLYYLDTKNNLIKIDKKQKSPEKEIIKKINIEREKHTIIFVSSNKEGYLTIEKVKIKNEKGEILPPLFI